MSDPNTGDPIDEPDEPDEADQNEVGSADGDPEADTASGGAPER